MLNPDGLCHGAWAMAKEQCNNAYMVPRQQCENQRRESNASTEKRQGYQHPIIAGSPAGRPKKCCTKGSPGLIPFGLRFFELLFFVERFLRPGNILFQRQLIFKGVVLTVARRRLLIIFIVGSRYRLVVLHKKLV